MELTELLKKYDNNLNLKYDSKNTKDGYRNAINRYIKDNDRVYRMSTDNIKQYMSNFRKIYSNSYFNIMGSSLILLYRDVLNQPLKMKWFKSIKTERKFHRIITNDEFIQMMKNAKNLKHKVILIILYSTGIRETELINIKLSDIDFNSKRIFIKSLKNGKNRYSPLKELTERYIKAYIRGWSPKEYLLNGQNTLKYSTSSVFQMIKKVSEGKVNPHLFRHTFATLMIEHEDVFYTQELLGQRNLNSTLHYNHISQERLIKSFNPLDKIAS
jgi:integrase